MRVALRCTGRPSLYSNGQQAVLCLMRDIEWMGPRRRRRWWQKVSRLLLSFGKAGGSPHPPSSSPIPAYLNGNRYSASSRSRVSEGHGRETSCAKERPSPAAVGPRLQREREREETSLCVSQPREQSRTPQGQGQGNIDREGRHAHPMFQQQVSSKKEVRLPRSL